MLDQWQPYLLLILGIIIFGVGLWMVTSGSLGGLAVLFFGLFLALVAVVALIRSHH